MTSHERLRVCFDARKFRDGGIGVYIRNVIYGLMHADIDVTLLTNDAAALEKTLEFLGVSTNSKVGAVKGEGQGAGSRGSVRATFRLLTVQARPFTFGELFGLRREVVWKDFDLFHTPNYLLPFGVPCPSVITVHDLIHIRHPERRRYPFLSLPLLAQSSLRASRIVCVSNSTRDELFSLFRFFSKLRLKVDVVRNALCPSFVGRWRQRRNETSESGSSRGISGSEGSDLLRSRFSLTQPFFLSVLSTVKPHKGVSDLLESFRELERWAEKERIKLPPLVLVGQGTETLVQMERLLQSADALKYVRLLGSVSQEELFHLYDHASALIVPSFREGFCLPVIEAQSVRTPVIARPVPAVLENLSPRDVVCKDFSQRALLEGIQRFLIRERSGVKITFSHEELWQDSFMKRVDPITLGAKLLDTYWKALKLPPPSSMSTREDGVQCQKLEESARPVKEVA